MPLIYKIQKLIHINNESHKDKAINQLKVLSKRNHLVNLKLLPIFSNYTLIVRLKLFQKLLKDKINIYFHLKIF